MERAGVWLGDRVRFRDAREAFDGRAIEADSLFKGTFQLCGSHSDRLEEALDIRKPQADETDVSLFDGPQHKFLLAIHGFPL